MSAEQTSTMSQRTLTRQFAALCADFSWEAIPEGVRGQAKLIALDTLGAMLSASRPTFPGTRRLSEFVRSESSDGLAIVVGTDLRASPTFAALMNGYLAYALDVESHHGPSVVHAAAAVVPASLAAAQLSGADGAAFLSSVVLGIDVACRVSFALGPNDLYQRTFHPTSVAGTFGAAVAAARLLGADSEQLERTLGLAATEANGLLAWASDESEESRPLNPGLAARNGVTAARLAMLGFGAPVGIFDPEAKYNVFRAWSLDGTGNPSQLTVGFGETFAIMGLTIKQHACCAFLHPAVDGLLDIMRTERLAPRDISTITIRFPRAGSPMIDDNPLRSHRAQYMLPVAAVRGHVSFDDVIHDRSSEEEVRRLSEATTFIQDEDLNRFYPERYATIIEIGASTGRTFSRRIDWARGTPENPMTTEEIVAKFRKLAGQRLDRPRVDRIISLVSELDRSPTLTEMFRLITLPDAD